MRNDVRRPGLGTAPPSREFALLAAVLVAVVAALLVVTLLGVDALSAVRTYVGGSGNWSNAQKDAVHHLTRYALTGNEAHWRAYEAAMAVPRANARVRRIYEDPAADAEDTRPDYVEGGNDPADLGVSMALYRYGTWMPEMRRAIENWVAADTRVTELQEVAESLRAEMRSDAPDPARVSALLGEVGRLNEEIGAITDDFADVLGEASRRVRRIVRTAAFTASGLLLVVALVAAARLMGRVRRAERRFRSLVEHGHDVILILRTDGTVTYASPSIRSLTGRAPEELEGRGIIELLHEDDRAAARAALARVASDPSAAASVEARVRHTDGSWRTVASTGTGLPDEPGGSTVVVNARDITEERALEARLVEGQRMESVGRLAGGVAHDFNNVLTAILGSAHLAREGLGPGSAAMGELDRVVEAARRGSALTRQLLAFARRQVIETSVFTMNDVLRDMEPMLRRLIDERIEMRLALCDDDTSVCAGRVQIEQVVMNLVANARDAMPTGGVLVLATSRRPAAGPGGDVVLEVRDSGEAMNEAVRQHVFEPFFTTKRASGGTGLGLATCYGIVTQSGGTITVESEPGRGTTFRVALPFVLDRAPAALPGRESVVDAVRGEGTVLVAEDEPDVRRVAVGTLRRAGFRVLEAADGDEALRVARENAVDLVVTDVVMPRRSGPELVRELAATGQRPRVLFISGYTEDEALLRVPSFDLAFLEKPFEPSVLVRRVAELLARPASAAPAASPPASGRVA